MQFAYGNRVALRNFAYTDTVRRNAISKEGEIAMKLQSFRVFTFLGFALLLVLTITSCGQEKATKSEKKVESSTPAVQQPKVVLPTYIVLEEDVYDAPIKTQVTLNVLVSGEISDSGLRALLNQLYSSTKARRGFKNHNSPTNIYIYAFTTKERYESGMGLWIAMLQKSYDDVKPTISIKESQITQLGAKPEEKFGLSEAKRKQIWYEIVKAEDRTTTEAEQKYPLSDPLKPGYSQSIARKQLEKQAELQDILNEKYENELAKKYGLTRKQLDEIAVEGLIKDWSFPK